MNRKGSKYIYYRRPRTRAEAQANQEGWERAKRRPHRLPTNWDDLWPCHQKSWKAKRKTQYYPEGKGKEHQIIVDADSIYEWDLTHYFDDHDIPYRLEYVNKSYQYKHYKKKRVSIGCGPVWIPTRTKKDGKVIHGIKLSHYTQLYEWVDDGWEWRTATKIVAYKLTWWYDKDIGIDYILDRCRPRRIYSFE